MMSTIGSHHEGNEVEGRELPLRVLANSFLLATQLPTVGLDVTLLATEVESTLLDSVILSPGLLPIIFPWFYPVILLELLVLLDGGVAGESSTTVPGGLPALPVGDGLDP